MKKGLLLINLGTPDSTNYHDVAKYLARFLSDRRVIDLPMFFRYLFVYGVIVPFRTFKTTQAYKKIWTTSGSPLLIHAQALTKALDQKLQGICEVQLGMRYGKPALEKALQSLLHCQEIIVLPLYPQYASASTGSSLAAVFRLLSQTDNIPSLRVIHEFHEHPAFIRAQAAQITPYLNAHEFVLFSYHGLPERQVINAGCTAICQTSCPSAPETACYRAKCYRTTTLISESLQLKTNTFDTSFQSRLGRIPWIKPYTEAHLHHLRQVGIKRLLVVCPAFTADCLETLEEIGVKAQETWSKLGGEKLTLVPSLNASEKWVDAILEITGL
jgi:protoporphyrin/coproporphyrin ferrochelatase